ncbi:DHA2 family efflux MFS transporter permease subunit [Sphingomonas canadensis]|uniref:DHA2 family efflux MFS transporter permease subunit n=1 Tax=Sphingomonas canadensis TaxID=1219257 RepID=A0ABW3HDT3_9SPHN|nr:DHA2 family efflux MFS transporter permease subunit [Sphingomonas canadensis]MCW3837528.1 DHA2 family efflux MFS transporter permease subunit [Sphingomonas canadensis]
MASASPSTPAEAAPPAPPRPGVAALPVRNRALLTLGVMLATIMQILDTTIANVALPHMQTALGATADTITWVLTSYIIATAIAIPITGWLSDRIGSRNLFLISVVGFVLASALCGMATSLAEMVLFRILQGVSAAFMNPLSQTVMLDINPPERQAQAMSIWGMGIMIGPILGPVLGGWLTENFDWRWVFYVNLPIGVFCFAVLWALLPSRPIRKRQFDLFGFALFSLGIAALQLMLDRGQGEDWFGSTEIWIEALVAAIALWMFAVHMATARNPMFERELWKNRNLITAIGFMQVIGVVMMATMALLPPMLQTLYGYSVLDTGLLLMPRGLGVLITMFVSAQLVMRGVDARWVVGVGLSMAAWSLYEMTHWTIEMNSWPFIFSGFIQGLGMGLVFMPLNGMAFATLPPKYRTEGASLLNLSRNIGASVGISLCTTVLARSIQTSHADLVPHLTAPGLDGFDPNLLRMMGPTGDSIMAMADAIVNQQAAMIGYLNDFKAMMIVTALSIPLVLLLRRPKTPIANDPAAAGH